MDLTDFDVRKEREIIWDLTHLFLQHAFQQRQQLLTAGIQVLAKR
jgi:hypothetical protein